jgi:uncharacterized protein (TIGR04255 family)
MARQRHLRNPPISEALVDFRVVRLSRPFGDESLSQLRAWLGDRYPIVERREGFEASVKLQAAPVAPATTTRRFNGFFFKSPDRVDVAQFRVDGFTFNRLRPYTSWEDILPRALDLWKLYVDLTEPEAVTRLAVRYINKLKFTPPSDLSRWLTAPPTIAPGYPSLVSEFLTRMRLHEREEGLGVIVTQVSEASAEPDVMRVVLDIDAYTEEIEFQPRDGRIGEVLEILRTLKNRIFFGALTEDAIGGFE